MLTDRHLCTMLILLINQHQGVIKIIGLEYILKINNIQYQDIANELGIDKQNITFWITEKRQITKKYIPILSKRFKISEIYFQKTVNDFDKLIIQQAMLKNKLSKNINTGQKDNNELLGKITIVNSQIEEQFLLNQISLILNEKADNSILEQINYRTPILEDLVLFVDLLQSYNHNDLLYATLIALTIVDNKQHNNKDKMDHTHPMTQEIVQVLDKYNNDFISPINPYDNFESMTMGEAFRHKAVYNRIMELLSKNN